MQSLLCLQSCFHMKRGGSCRAIGSPTGFSNSVHGNKTRITRLVRPLRCFFFVSLSLLFFQSTLAWLYQRRRRTLSLLTISLIFAYHDWHFAPAPFLLVFSLDRPRQWWWFISSPQGSLKTFKTEKHGETLQSVSSCTSFSIVDSFVIAPAKKYDPSAPWTFGISGLPILWIIIVEESSHGKSCIYIISPWTYRVSHSVNKKAYL